MKHKANDDGLCRECAEMGEENNTDYEEKA
jgi:hypothetical protein